MTIHPVVGFLIAYAAGSIPAAFLAGKSRGIDLRRHGSGNLGATNVVRTLGWKIGLLVFLFDAAKGALPVLYLPPITESTMSPQVLGIIYGLGAILGHARPLFLGFKKGGKGVATSAGVFAALAPVALLISFSVFVAILLATGYVSLGSLISALVLPPVLAYTHGVRTPIFAVSVLLVAFVFWTHRANIGRLRRGEEHRFGRKATG
jgi:acyl phosphate:glycerol-3-phosphate acyltransferase